MGENVRGILLIIGWLKFFFLQVLLDIHHKVLYLTPVYDSSSAKNKVFLVCSVDWRRPRQQTRLIVEYLTFGKRPPTSIYKELDGKWPRKPESIPFLKTSDYSTN